MVRWSRLALTRTARAPGNPCNPGPVEGPRASLPELSQHLGWSEPDHRSGTFRGEAFDVDTADRAFSERYWPASREQVRRQLTEVRFVTDERDAPPPRRLRKLRHHRGRSLARCERVEQLDRRRR